jgi:hypothetical protein
MPLDADDKKWLLDNLGPVALLTYRGIPKPKRFRTDPETYWALTDYVQQDTEYDLAALDVLRDPQTLASAIAAALPPDSPVTAEVLEAALKKVLGGLDNQ